MTHLMDEVWTALFKYRQRALKPVPPSCSVRSGSFDTLMTPRGQHACSRPRAHKLRAVIAAAQVTSERRSPQRDQTRFPQPYLSWRAALLPVGALRRVRPKSLPCMVPGDIRVRTCTPHGPPEAHSAPWPREHTSERDTDNF